MSEGTTSQFSPHRNCYINSKVTGAGTLQLNIPYLREYVQGDWSDFSGRLIANGVNSKASEGSLLLLDKQPKLTKTAIELRGNARLCYWSTNGSQTIGGLSGVSGTYLMGSSKKDKSFNCVVLSSPELVVGETYTLIMGDHEAEITLESTSYSNRSGGFGFGFGGGDSGSREMRGSDEQTASEEAGE